MIDTYFLAFPSVEELSNTFVARKHIIFKLAIMAAYRLAGSRLGYTVIIQLKGALMQI